jgi:hypothetical protein
MTFKSKQQVAYVEYMQAQKLIEQAREYAFYLIEQTDNDIDQCRALFEDQFPDNTDLFEQCLREATS